MEGEDFRIIGAFARKLRKESVSNRRDFAVVPVGGFNPDRIKSLRTGHGNYVGKPNTRRRNIGSGLSVGQGVCRYTKKCREFCEYAKILDRKEIENFVLMPSAIDRAVARRVSDQVRRTGKEMEYLSEAGGDIKQVRDRSKKFSASSVSVQSSKICSL